MFTRKKKPDFPLRPPYSIREELETLNRHPGLIQLVGIVHHAAQYKMKDERIPKISKGSMDVLGNTEPDNL